MGAALHVMHEGETIIDLWAGVADARSGRPVGQADTPSVIFSCTKGLVSILAAQLVGEGRLDYAAPVARYWPEFAAAGKAGVTVGQALAHQAGLSAPRQDLTEADILDWDRVVLHPRRAGAALAPGHRLCLSRPDPWLGRRRNHPPRRRPCRSARCSASALPSPWAPMPGSAFPPIGPTQLRTCRSARRSPRSGPTRRPSRRPTGPTRP